MLEFWRKLEGDRMPLLREAPDGADAQASSCFPMVPFGNRVKDNGFAFDGLDYVLEPNTDRDPHYLHGDGWLSEWSLLSSSRDAVELGFAHRGAGTPYSYRAAQAFVLTGRELTMTLSVQNLGSRALPFGIGFHPFFPLTPQTTLFAPARRMWSEGAGYLPGEAGAIPQDLDFSEPSELPDCWVNNGFEDWSGEALIDWPERRMRLQVTADPVFRHAFLFLSDTHFDPQFRRDYFCFEPMSHLANGHNLPDFGGLRTLPPGQTLSGSIRLRPQDL